VNTEDRSQQVQWLMNLAANIAQNMGSGSARDLVEYALGDEGRDAYQIYIPEWFDAHDRALLVSFVDDCIWG
jgi:hypothetical protein